MNSLTPRQTAIYIALFASFVTVAAVIVIYLLNLKGGELLALIAGLLVFLSVFIFSSSYINKIILQKIIPLYKTIQNVSISKKDIPNDFDDKDILKAVRKDVILWAKRKTLEIAHLQQLEKYRREYIGNVSHELKTPLFNIQGYILTLLDGGLEDASINRHYLERAEKSVNRLISIINDLDSISRLESGELKLELVKCNIVKIFEESFEIHEMMAAERGIKLRFARKSDKPVPVLADKKRILEAINNLIANSIKYGKKNGTTTVDFIDMEDNVMIEVTDNGIGIEQKDMPRIFERFFRTDKSRSREMGGTGLGLSIVKHIIEAHGQTINVHSEAGEGSSFSFTLKKA
ncbi:MAG: sensor histidine kinase [Bacteroidales bacterium]|nr:sensor histidine kinase [Bacteroidales bacterium]